MKRWVAATALVLCCVWVGQAAAQEPPPPARKGFQMAVRSGYAVAMGRASGEPGHAMSDLFSGQVPVIADVGYKPLPQLFLGGYAGLSLGHAAGQFREECGQLATFCSSASFRLGAELAYQILPAGRVDPWLAYGIGLETISVSGAFHSASFTGFEFAHFMAGLDFRVTRGFGIGPFVDFSLGTYTSERVEEIGTTADRQDIARQTTHEWLFAGLRVVVFP